MINDSELAKEVKLSQSFCSKPINQQMDKVDSPWTLLDHNLGTLDANSVSHNPLNLHSSFTCFDGSKDSNSNGAIKHMKIAVELTRCLVIYGHGMQILILKSASDFQGFQWNIHHGSNILNNTIFYLKLFPIFVNWNFDILSRSRMHTNASPWTRRESREWEKISNDFWVLPG